LTVLRAGLHRQADAGHRFPRRIAALAVIAAATWEVRPRLPCRIHVHRFLDDVRAKFDVLQTRAIPIPILFPMNLLIVARKR
jgi:hypothetical protein